MINFGDKSNDKSYQTNKKMIPSKEEVKSQVPKSEASFLHSNRRSERSSIHFGADDIGFLDDQSSIHQ